MPRARKTSRDCTAPAHVVNVALWCAIKDRLRAKTERWNAYTSGQLVQQYKRKGGKFRGKKAANRLLGGTTRSGLILRGRSRVEATPHAGVASGRAGIRCVVQRVLQQRFQGPRLASGSRRSARQAARRPRFGSPVNMLFDRTPAVAIPCSGCFT